ncbi:hypothetical protein [Blastomonas sp. CCH2-A2]|uniref:hypothetical protein n=1 Tax=Blastomonas sp. CCH2-A2 TaxID=1768788 RepID=UPI000824048D|nr:hypothetical protein [Blastomonas sp. CCH2-A2]
MKTLAIGIAVAPLASIACMGCSDPVERAEQEYEIVSEESFQGSAAKCEAAAKVKDAALAEQDRAAYELWSMTEFNDCSAARRGW